MQLHTETWGHVSLASAPTASMEAAEEAYEILMLRCRHSTKFMRAYGSFYAFLLSGLMPSTSELICNPRTLQDLATIFCKKK